MKRIRIQRPTNKRERQWLEVPPLEPRDPDIVPAKASPSPSPPEGRSSDESWSGGRMKGASNA